MKIFFRPPLVPAVAFCAWVLAGSLLGLSQAGSEPGASEPTLSAVWANNGEDKVTQRELRASKNPTAVVNSVWDGRKIKLFGARNEVVNFNLIFEAKKQTVNNISIQFGSLDGPAGAKIDSPPLDRSRVFDWSKKNIELFFVRYLQIKGLSYFAYNSGSMGFDERIVPKALQRPWKGTTYRTTGQWTDRPNHDAYYPEIAVPLELHPTFNIVQGTNQSIWADIYIPKRIAPGTYTGTVSVSQGKAQPLQIPVELKVLGFTLPDVPSAKSMLFFSLYELSRRLTGIEFPNYGNREFKVAEQASIIALQLAHRHKLSLIGDWEMPKSDQPSDSFAKALTGTLFTPDRGYSGPGMETGNNIYSILPYGQFRTAWKAPKEADITKEAIWPHADAWESWFKSHAPNVDHFLYLCDECAGSGGGVAPEQVNDWAAWLKANPGVGKSMKSFATISFDIAATRQPNLDYVANTAMGNNRDDVNSTALWEASIKTIRARPGSKIMIYNPTRPTAGTFALEDDGVALRQVAWAQYKKGVDRIFYWHSDYYSDVQGNGKPEHNVFQHAATFGGSQYTQDPMRGEWSVGHTNGEGVLLYPGTDKLFPKDSYGVNGVFASLRLKFWRRGVQDIDYVSLANAIDPAATKKIVAKMVPRAFWDYKDLGGWMSDDISWSVNPDDWEAARLQLAQILEKAAARAVGQ